MRHHRIPPPSPNHNAVCERFQGTALEEFYRPAFHCQHFAHLADLNAQFQGWLQHYNTRRSNRGHFMRGRTPTPSCKASYDDRSKSPPVTSTRALEGLGSTRTRVLAVQELLRLILREISIGDHASDAHPGFHARVHASGVAVRADDG